MRKIFARLTRPSLKGKPYPMREGASCFHILPYDARIPAPIVEYPNDETVLRLAEEYFPEGKLEVLERDSFKLLVRIEHGLKQFHWNPFLDHLSALVVIHEPA